MISVEKLRKYYEGNIVVDVPHLRIAEGEVVGLIGNNGAGKTTLFRLLLDLVKPDTGLVTIAEKPIKGKFEWKLFTAAFLDEGYLIDYLTPEEFFYFIGGLCKKNKATIDERLLTLVDIFNGEILNKGKYIRDLSKGNQSKVGVAACLIRDPQLLILDEPFANIDPSTQIRLKNIFKNLSSSQKVTIIISSHDLTHVTDICDRILLMEKGRIVKDIVTSATTLADLQSYFSI